MKTIYLLEPLTDKCRQWISENVHYEHTFGRSIVVEHRYIADLVQGLLDAGLKQGEDFNVW